MAVVVCPECGTKSEHLELRMTADDFCVECDFPLFWAADDGGDADVVHPRADVDQLEPPVVPPEEISATPPAAVVPPEEISATPPAAAVSPWNGLSIVLGVLSAVLAVALVVVLVAHAV